MEIVFLMVLPATLWAQAWYFLDLYNNTKALGVLCAASAVGLGGMVLFAGGSLPTLVGSPADTNALLATFIILWAIYLAVASGVFLGGYDERTLGLFSLFMAVISALYGVYFLAGGEILGGLQIGYLVHWPMGTAALALSVFATLVFFNLAPPYPRLRYVTGWYTLVISIVIAVLAGLVTLGAQVA